MFNLRLFWITTVVLAVTCTVATAQDFSIDAASPECLPPLPLFSPADIIHADGGFVFVLVPAANIGLNPLDEIDAFSNGTDILWPGGPDNWIALPFSVTRGTLGAQGSAVAAQAAADGAAGDMFAIVIKGSTPKLPTPGMLWANAPKLGLTPLPPPPQSDLDGLQPPGGNELGVYFSVDAVTAAGLTAAGLACGPADILYQSNPGPNPAPLQVWARARLDLGLFKEDDIDALTVLEPYWMSGWGTLDGSDIVCVSLTPTSPTLLGPDGQPGDAGVDDDGVNGVDDMGEFLFPGSDDISAAAVIQVYPRPPTPTVVIPPGVLGLLRGDDLNAMCAFDPGKAHSPGPGTPTTDVDRSPTLSWSAGLWAASHEVYFGTSFNDVNDANRSNTALYPGVYRGPNDVGPDPCDPNRFTYAVPETLQLATTYYWRIDEVNEAYVPGPNEPNAPPDFRWKGYVWSFEVEGRAKNPKPANWAVDMARNVVLRWSPGTGAASHDVYFGSSFADVNDANTSSAAYQGNQTLSDVNYVPGLLEFGTTYYWRIDEVNEAHPNSTWKGDVWRFTTANYLVVDDFDSYGPGPALRAVWKDYWSGSLFGKNGAEVFVETDPNFTRSGQSMRYEYTNYKKKGPQYVGSEAEALASDLQIGTDWTIGGVKALTLYFYGDPCNSQDTTGVFNGIHQDQMYVALEDGDGNVGILKYPDMNDIKEDWWHEWNIDLQDPCLSDVNMANVSKVYIGFGGYYKTGQTYPGAGMDWGYPDIVYFDDIRLYPPRCVPVVSWPYGDIDGDCVIGVYDLDAMSADWLMGDYYTVDGNEMVYHPLESPAELYSEEPQGERVINLRDYAILAAHWLDEVLWP